MSNVLDPMVAPLKALGDTASSTRLAVDFVQNSDGLANVAFTVAHEVSDSLAKIEQEYNKIVGLLNDIGYRLVKLP